MRDEGLQPHDHDRAGQKGFNYMGPGFTSTPKGTAMREFFLDKGDPGTAALFHSSSMEYHLGRNPDALCMVTEFPLFLVETSPQNGLPENYLALKKELEKRKKQNPEYEGTDRLVSRFGIRPILPGKAMQLQQLTVWKALGLVETNIK